MDKATFDRVSQSLLFQYIINNFNEILIEESSPTSIDYRCIVCDPNMIFSKGFVVKFVTPKFMKII
jgi:hypothetical protein